MATHEPKTAAPLHLGLRDEGRLVTSEEFATADFDEPYRYERIDGRLVVVPPAGELHNTSSRPWRWWLGRYWGDHPDVIEDLLPEAWIRVDEGTDRIGDIGIYLVAEGAPPVPDRIPDMMFEIVSPDRKSKERDYIRKRADYDKFGVREYVIVDRFVRRVTVLTHAPGGYQERTLTAADIYTSPLLPGLAIPLAEVFG